MGIEKCPSDHELQSFQLGDLPEASLGEVARHLEECTRCESRAQSLDTIQDPLLVGLKELSGTDIVAAPATMHAADANSTQAAGDLRPFAFLPPAQQADEIGRLANYRILRLLGQGGMAYVFHAEDLTLCRPVALKVMAPRLNRDANGWQRFLREARIMASIKHDNLVTVFQAGKEGDVIYLAMELLEGETLEAWLNRSHDIELNEILRVAREITTGLGAIHHQGLVHRDLKPANIWLEERPSAAGSRLAADSRKPMADSRVKILDFGLARWLHDDVGLTQHGMIMGTPSYMSPEQANAKSLDFRTDLFSLGCILYRLCTGELPFQGVDPLPILVAVASHHPKPPHELKPRIPKKLSQLVMKLLAKDPNQRPASTDEVLNSLGLVGEGGIATSRQADKPTAARVGPPGKTAPSSKRPPSAPLIDDTHLMAQEGKRPNSARSQRQQEQEHDDEEVAASGQGRPWLIILGLPAAIAGTGLLIVGAIVAIVLVQRNKDASSTSRAQSSSATSSTPVAEQRFLRDLPLVSQESWYRSPPPPREIPGAEQLPPFDVRVGGQLSPHGIFMHAPPPPETGRSNVSFKLNKEYSKFRARVSLNDGPEASSVPLVFAVYGDGVQLWHSYPVFMQRDGQKIEISVSDVNVLKLEITCPPGPIGGAHAVWIEPIVER